MQGMLEFGNLLGQFTRHISEHPPVDVVEAGAGKDRQPGGEMYRDKIPPPFVIVEFLRSEALADHLSQRFLLPAFGLTQP